MKTDATENGTGSLTATRLGVYRELLRDALLMECVSVIEAPLPVAVSKTELPEESKEAIAKIGGKGGGSPFCAQGFGKDGEGLQAAIDGASMAMRQALSIK